MAQSFVQFYAHIVFHTKNNKQLIKPGIEDDLYSYIGGILRNYRSNPIKIGGTSDHVHVLCTLPKTMALADLVEEIKKSSSKWIKSRGNEFLNFYWQDGYGGFSVGQNGLETLKKYILNQKTHHEKQSPEDEYKNLLEEYGIEYDEKYL